MGDGSWAKRGTAREDSRPTRMVMRRLAGITAGRDRLFAPPGIKRRLDVATPSPRTLSPTSSRRGRRIQAGRGLFNAQRRLPHRKSVDSDSV